MMEALKLLVRFQVDFALFCLNLRWVFAKRLHKQLQVSIWLFLPVISVEARSEICCMLENEFLQKWLAWNIWKEVDKSTFWLCVAWTASVHKKWEILFKSLYIIIKAFKIYISDFSGSPSYACSQPFFAYRTGDCSDCPSWYCTVLFPLAAPG